MTEQTNTETVETCKNGHPKAEFWTVTPKGRKHCRRCSVEASQRSRAKNGRPARKNPLKLGTEALDLLEKVAGFKNTKAETAEEIRHYVAACRG